MQVTDSYPVSYSATIHLQQRYGSCKRHGAAIAHVSNPIGYPTIYSFSYTPIVLGMRALQATRIGPA